MRNYLKYQIGLIPVVYLLWYFLYPEILGDIEAQSFFVRTPDYFTQKFTQSAGVTSLIADFLSQFYRWREVAALLQVFFMFCVIVITGFLFYRMKKQEDIWMAFIPVPFFICMQLYGPGIANPVGYVIFMGIILLYACILSFRMRIVYIIVFSFFLPWLLPAGCALLLYGTFITLELLLYGGRSTRLSIMIFSCGIAFLSTLFAGYFILGERPTLFVRFTVGPDQILGGLYFIIYAFPILLLLLSYLIRFRKKPVAYALSFFVMLLTVIIFTTSPQTRYREKRIGIEQAAMASQWNLILNAISEEEALHDSNLQRYVLLALSEQGKLPDNFFKLNPTSEDCFYFYRGTTPFARMFNSIFYKTLGIYNESIHQLFEIAVQTENGMTFQCMRLLTDGYLKMGNRSLAEKYLSILSRSTCHDDWVKSRKMLLDALDSNPVQTPVKSRHDIFIGAYSFLREMSSLLEENPENIRVQEYYLCALLIRNETEAFSQAIYSLPYMKQKEVPQYFRKVLNLYPDR